MPIDPRTITWDEPAPKGVTWDEPPPEPQRPPRTIGDRVVQGAADLATGFGQVGTMLLAPYDAAADLVTGRPQGTGNRERRQGVEGFGQEHGANDWTSVVNQVAPEMMLTGKPIAGVEGAVANILPKSVARFGGAAADVAANAAWEGAKAAARDEDATKAALFGGGGALGGRVLNRAVAGLVKPTDEAAKLLQQGVRLTPGQAGGGKGMGAVARFGEEGVASIPFVGAPVRGAREQAVEDWNRMLIHGTLVDNAAPVGRQAVSEKMAGAGKAYKRIFPEGHVLAFSEASAKVYDDKVAELAMKVAPGARDKFITTAEWIGDQVKEGVDASQWKEIVQRELNTGMKAALRSGDYSLFKALKELNGELTEALPKIGGPSADMLKATDKGYAHAKLLESASSKAPALKRGGVMYPAEVATTAHKKGNERVLKQALAAQELLGAPPTLMGQTLNVAKAVGLGVGGVGAHPLIGAPPAFIAYVGSTEPGRKFLLGQYTFQQLAQENPALAAQIGRAMMAQEETQ